MRAVIICLWLGLGLGLGLGLTLALPTAVQAQDDDRSQLVRFIESALSDGNARQVRIEGFAGALSSTATLDRLTIADADGIWLTIENAELTWTRSALLRGALEVDRLAAARVVLDRLPQGAPATPAPEATPFNLPDLPVSITLGDLAIDRIELGAPIVGMPVTASLSGAASLSGGNGAAALDLVRMDGPEGRFALSAEFTKDTGQLDLSLSLSEAPGGVTATLLRIPQAPAVALDVAGAGPLDALTIDLTLATDGVPRVSGALISDRTDAGDQRITARLTGDLAHLVVPDYQPFFGPRTGVDAVLIRPAAGGTLLDEINLSSRSLSLQGSGALAADNSPLRFQLTGQIADEAGDVRLPIPGSPVVVSNARLSLAYDRANGDGWTGTTTITGLQAGALAARTVDLDLSGTISAPGSAPGSGPLRVTADLRGAIEGMRHSDPAVQAALGRQARLSLSAAWQAGSALRLTGIDAAGDRATLLGSASLEPGDAALMTRLDLTASLPDLAAFSGLAGQDLAGAAQISLVAEAELLSAAFEASAAVTTQSLRAGDALPPALSAGETRIETTLRRDGDGLHLDRFALTGTALTASANGLLSSTESTLTATARLRDAGLVTPALSGPVDADLTLTRAGGDLPWTLDGDVAGRGGVTTAISGQVGLPDGAVDLSLSGSLPLALADRFIAPRSARGNAQFDLTLTGPPSLSALAGRLTANGARVSLPTLGMVLAGLNITAAISDARLSLSGDSRVQPAGRVSFDGTLDLASSGLPGRIGVTLAGVEVTEDGQFRTTIDSGQIALEGAMTAGPDVRGQITLGQTDLLLEDVSVGASEPIPEIRHSGASGAHYATLTRAGVLAQGGGNGAPVGLDLTIDAPARIFLRGNGVDAELGGTIRLGGTSAAVAPSGQFDLIRGRLSFLGQRFDISEATASLQGSFDPYLRIVAATEASDITVLVTIEGLASAPDLTISSTPVLPQDEILARLFFRRSATSLSPVQALQLVDAVSGFTGGQGLIGPLRDRFGLDDLDLTTDEEGAANLRVGRYLSENAYTDAEIGADGEAEVSLNIDLTPDITARGSFATDGSSSIGVFFERDY